MSITLEYHNVTDVLVGQRTPSDSEALVDDVLRATSFSAFVSVASPLQFIDSIFIGNYRDEAQSGKQREPYLVYITATGKPQGRKANSFEGEVWCELLYAERDRIAALFSGVPVGDLPSTLERGKVRFDWLQKDVLLEITFPVPRRETAGSFEAGWRSFDDLLSRTWCEVERLSSGVVAGTNERELSSRTVFLCHSSKDKRFVRRLASALKVQGISPWLDEEEILVGHDFIEKMEDGLSRVDFVGVVLSPNFISGGPWAKEEFRSALTRQVSERRAVVLPVLYKECDIPPLLRSKAYADFRKSFEFGLRQLVRSIRGLSAMPTVDSDGEAV